MSITTIQVLNRINALGAPASLSAGELAYNQPDTATPTNPGDALYVGDGVNVNLLVGADRQVELAGDQAISGTKTFNISNIKILGGSNLQLMQTDGNGNLSWTNVAGGGLTSVAVDGITIQGDGTDSAPIHVVPDSTTVATDGVTIDGAGTTASPLAAIKWNIEVDGVTITGNGITIPLSAVTGEISVVSDGTTITGNGTTADPLEAVRQTGPVATTGATLSGNGTTASPLAVVANTVAVAASAPLTGNGLTATPLGLTLVTNTTLTGAGTTANPLGVAADSVAVLTDGETLEGNGTTGNALAIREVYVNTTLSGVGTPGNPLSVVNLPVARQIGIVATGGTTITETPASFDGSANVNITGFEVTNLDCGTY